MEAGSNGTDRSNGLDGFGSTARGFNGLQRASTGFSATHAQGIRLELERRVSFEAVDRIARLDSGLGVYDEQARRAEGEVIPCPEIPNRRNGATTT